MWSKIWTWTSGDIHGVKFGIGVRILEGAAIKLLGMPQYFNPVRVIVLQVWYLLGRF